MGKEIIIKSQNSQNALKIQIKKIALISSDNIFFLSFNYCNLSEGSLIYT